MSRGSTLVLGGGISGLAAAYTLQAAGQDVLLLEAEDRPGGTARTVSLNGYQFDLTGHALHLRDESVRHFLFDTLGLGSRLVETQRKAAIYHGGHIVPYPFQYNLSYLPEKKRDAAVLDYLKAVYTSDPETKDMSFRDYCLSFFGKGLSRLFMLPYNEKLWATTADKLTIEWMGRFVPRPDRDLILEGAFSDSSNERTGYNATFYYPKEGGIQMIADAIYEPIRDRVQLNSRVTEIDLKNRQVVTGERSFDYQYLVSTIPLNRFLELAGLPSLGKTLRWTIVRGYFFTIPSDAAPDHSWLYLPDRKYRAYRLGNFSKFSPSLSRNGYDVIWAECSVTGNSKKRFPEPEEIKQELMDIRLEGSDLSHAEYLGSFDIDPGYVVFDRRWREKVKIEKRLLRAGVYPAGRYGHWEYHSMEDSILDGITAARRILEKR